MFSLSYQQVSETAGSINQDSTVFCRLLSSQPIHFVKTAVAQ